MIMNQHRNRNCTTLHRKAFNTVYEKAAAFVSLTHQCPNNSVNLANRLGLNIKGK